MGLILKLPFGDDIRKIEIDSEKNISFLDHDLEYDIAVQAMGGEEFDESKLYRLYQEMGPEAFMSPAPSEWRPDPDAFDRDTCKDWTMRFVQALKKQGFRTLGTRIEDTPKNIARMIYQSGLFSDEISEITIYLDQLADDDDEVISWLVDWLGVAIENSNKYEGDDAVLAGLLSEYLDEGDVGITVGEILYCRNDRPYENTECWQFKLLVLGNVVHTWTTARQSQIWNPVTFDGSEYCDYADDDDVSEVEKAESLATALGMSIPETAVPGLPDHPTSDEAGDFAVLYEFAESYNGSMDREREVVVVPYEAQRDADDAIELSQEMFEDRSEDGNVNMTILRRLTPDEKHEREMKRRQGGFFEAEKEEPGWHNEWTPLKYE